MRAGALDALPLLRRVLQRFPLPAALAVVVGVCGILEPWFVGARGSWMVSGWQATVALCFLWSLLVDLAAEAYELPAHERATAALAGIAALVVLHVGEQALAVSRGLLLASLIVALGVVGHLGRPRDDPAFWLSSCRIWRSVVLALACGTLLALGLMIVLAMLEPTSELHPAARLVAMLWSFAAGLGVPVLLLATLPDARPGRAAPPSAASAAVERVVRSVLVPLSLAGVAVLHVAGLWLLLTGTAPSVRLGAVAMAQLVLGLATLALAANADEAAGGLVRIFRRWWGVLSIAPAALLLAAVWLKVRAYGVTEPRYLGGLVGLWALVVAVLWMPRGWRDPRLLSATLAVLLFLAAVGPLSLRSAVATSQARHFVALLTRGAPQPPQPELVRRLTAEEARRARAIAAFLIARQETDQILRWWPHAGAPAAGSQQGARPDRAALAAVLAELGALSRDARGGEAHIVVFYATRPAHLGVVDGQLVGPLGLQLSADGGRDSATVRGARGSVLSVTLEPTRLVLEDARGRRAVFVLDRIAHTFSWFAKGRSQPSGAQPPRIFTPDSGDLAARLVLTSLQAQAGSERNTLYTSLFGWIILPREE